MMLGYGNTNEREGGECDSMQRVFVRGSRRRRPAQWPASESRVVRTARRARVVGCYDIALAAASYLSSRVARSYRQHLLETPRTGRVWDKARLLPVPYHYYEPVIRGADVDRKVWEVPDPLLGVDMCHGEQLSLLGELAPYARELLATPRLSRPGAPTFNLQQGNYGPGDADSLYAIIRWLKPRKVVEVGSGYSTLLVREALLQNEAESYVAHHTCIEPFEMPWLERLAAQIVRIPVETLDPEFFTSLSDGDVLFIDSSHVVRTGGDVTYLLLDVLPRLRSGVYVHFHDIFLPGHYPREWIVDLKRFWTEQYLLQAFLAFNREFQVMLALNYLAKNARDDLAAALPLFGQQPASEPGAFWIRRR